jgi:exonuclease VII small subunit
MKKAQWKEPPVGRKFGQRPELQHIQTLESRIKTMEEKEALLKFSYDTIKRGMVSVRTENEKLRSAQLRYKWLRAKGVVLEHDGEFKHLKGDDMDNFFESTPTLLYDVQSSIYSQALANSMQQTKEAVAQTLIYGSNATHMWLNEVQDPTKWP